MLIRVLVLCAVVGAACEEGNGPNSQFCVEKRMNWLELEHWKRQLTDPAALNKTSLQQDLIVNANMQCFPGFTLRTQ